MERPALELESKVKCESLEGQVSLNVYTKLLKID